MTKQERINTVAAAIKQHEELTHVINKPSIDKDGTYYEVHWTAVVDSKQLAAALVEEGFGNLRRYRQTLIELYLKGNTAELLKFIIEEV